MQTTQIQSIIPNLGQAETSPEWWHLASVNSF
jgi:hypothetical protein